MSRTALVLLALERRAMSAFEIADAVGCREITARSCLSELMNRVMVTASRKRTKLYSLTTLGQMEADRLRSLGGDARTKTPAAPKVENADVSTVISRQPLLASVWGSANV